MSQTVRSGPKTLVGQQFYDIEQIGAYSFCPDSNDASTPATQVHVEIQLKAPPRHAEQRRETLLPFIMRYHGTDTIDAFIEALIEHRTYVFGRHEWKNDFPEQEE